MGQATPQAAFIITEMLLIFGTLDGMTITGRNAPAITIINELKGLLPYGSAFGQSGCGTTPPLPLGVTTFADTCNHLHMQVPKGTF
jgi:hypothetical protein